MLKAIVRKPRIRLSATILTTLSGTPKEAVNRDVIKKIEKTLKKRQ